MKNLTVTVNGVAYNVTVEENTRQLALCGLLRLLHPLPLVLFLSTLPCRAPSWTSRSRQALLLRLAMLS